MSTYDPAEYQLHKEQYKARSRRWRNKNLAREKSKSAARARRYYRKHRAEVKIKAKAWRERNKDKIFARQRRKQRGYHLKSSYGLDIAIFRAEVRRLGRRCPICLRRFGTYLSSKRDPVVDHDGKTGRLKGVICRNCNAAIGGLGDNIINLQRAIVYLSQGDDLRERWEQIMKSDQLSS